MVFKLFLVVHAVTANKGLNLKSNLTQKTLLFFKVLAVCVWGGGGFKTLRVSPNLTKTVFVFSGSQTTELKFSIMLEILSHKCGSHNVNLFFLKINVDVNTGQSLRLKEPLIFGGNCHLSMIVCSFTAKWRTCEFIAQLCLTGIFIWN